MDQFLADTQIISIPVNALTAAGALRILIDFTLSNVRRFYSSVGNPMAVKGLNAFRSLVCKRFLMSCQAN